MRDVDVVRSGLQVQQPIMGAMRIWKICRSLFGKLISIDFSIFSEHLGILFLSLGGIVQVLEVAIDF